MFRKILATIAALAICVSGATNTYAAGANFSIKNTEIVTSNNIANSNIGFEGNRITTDIILLAADSSVSFGIELTNDTTQAYRIIAVADDLEHDYIESSYDFSSSIIEAGSTTTLTANYIYVTEQDATNATPIALGEIEISLSLEAIENEGGPIAPEDNTPSKTPLTVDKLPFFVAIFILSVAAVICLTRKNVKIASALAACALVFALADIFITNANAADSETVKLYISGLSVAPHCEPHIVHFDANNGIGTMDDQEFTPGTVQTLSANLFHRNYFDFVEWNTEADGSGDSYADEASINFIESGETTLYAQWSTDHSVAFLDTGRAIDAKLKRMSGLNITETTNLFEARLNNIYSIEKGTELPEGFDTEDDNNIISTPDSPYKIYAWKKNYSIYIYSDAEVIKGNRDMTETFVNFYNTSRYPGIADWDMSETENFSSMFAVNNGINNVDFLSNWDTSSAKTLYRMFYRNFTLYNIAGLSRWNTSNVTNLSLTFYWTKIYSLAPLSTTDRGDYTSWDVSNVTTMSYTFGANENSGATTVEGISNWNTSNVVNMSSMFSSWDWLEDISSLAPTQRDGYVSWDVSNVTNISEIFSNCDWIKSLHGLEDWNVSNVTTLYRTFYEMPQLRDISAISNWDIHNVTSMKQIFANDEKLTDISPIANWDTSNVEDMSSAFYYAKTLSDISPIAIWNTSKATDLSSMFTNTAITNTDALATTQRDGYVSWDVSNATTIAGMFMLCGQLTDLAGISNWNTSNVTTLGSFLYKTAITNVDELATTQRDGYVSWDVSNVKYLDGTFREIPTLTDIEGIVNWDVSNVISMERTFYHDSGLTYVRSLDAWQTNERLRCISPFGGIGTNNYPIWVN